MGAESKIGLERLQEILVDTVTSAACELDDPELLIERIMDKVAEEVSD